MDKWDETRILQKLGQKPLNSVDSVLLIHLLRLDITLLLCIDKRSIELWNWMCPKSTNKTYYEPKATH